MKQSPVPAWGLSMADIDGLNAYLVEYGYLRSPEAEKVLALSVAGRSIPSGGRNHAKEATG